MDLEDEVNSVNSSIDDENSIEQEMEGNDEHEVEIQDEREAK